jgi:hypothetical protein
MSSRQEPTAVAVARAHVDAWGNHDYNAARARLASDVRVVASTVDPMPPRVDLTGIEDYMQVLIQFAQGVVPGTTRVTSATGDDARAASSVLAGEVGDVCRVIGALVALTLILPCVARPLPLESPLLARLRKQSGLLALFLRHSTLIWIRSLSTLLGSARADRRLGAALRGDGADPPGLPQRLDPVAAAAASGAAMSQTGCDLGFAAQPTVHRLSSVAHGITSQTSRESPSRYEQTPPQRQRRPSSRQQPSTDVRRNGSLYLHPAAAATSPVAP